MAQYPGEMVDQIGRTIAGGATQAIRGIGGGIRSTGSQVQMALDRTVQTVGLRNSPAKIIHYPLDAVVETAENALVGVVTSISNIANGVTNGLDSVPQTFDPRHLNMNLPALRRR